MSKKHFIYRICGKRYALENYYVLKGLTPETMKTIPLTDEQRKEIAYLCVTKGGKAGLDYVKRLERAKTYKQKYYMTYGFVTYEDSQQYAYFAGMCCNLNAPLSEKKQLYDRVRSMFNRVQCRVSVSSQCTLDGNYKPTNIMKNYCTADLSRPVLIRLVA